MKMISFRFSLNLRSVIVWILKVLLGQLKDKQITGDVENMDVKGVVYDPLRVEPGFVFVAINIYTQMDKIEIPEGHDKIEEAVKADASVVVYSKDVPVPDGVVKIKVPDTRYALAILADSFYGHPSGKLKLIGITGTNGKTTTTHIVESIFIQNFKVGLIGTLYYKLQGVIHKSKDTTPEPPDLQAIMKEMADQDFDYCALEASSHGIDFHRLGGCKFGVAAFTNFTQDHLDYHKTMEAYLNTKLRLFKWMAEDDAAVVNIDDPFGHHFVEATKAKVLTYALDKKADIMAKNIEYHIAGTRYTLVTPQGEIQVNSRLIGRFNVYNSLCAVGIALSQNISLEVIKSGLEAPIIVAGRFELIDKGQDFSVVVDYAHTPDGMDNVLKMAKALNPKTLITVFGCGGDRDKEKRPIMGGIADQYSDLVIVTADNPRGENAADISNDIKAGIKETTV